MSLLGEQVLVFSGSPIPTFLLFLSSFLETRVALVHFTSLSYHNGLAFNTFPGNPAPEPIKRQVELGQVPWSNRVAPTSGWPSSTAEPYPNVWVYSFIHTWFISFVLPLSIKLLFLFDF
ncbi:hypothetical protein Egran_03235 [Elaphomyces granulatus]|uniref:Uncharacterized protein n=1 Tax=Elaphomyces granulatus TaxID=519963 RepID=A0A232LY03_9EURO|nr:hypothetical protein Egran_03235 [Elaphomyces granulatus]